MDANRFDTLLRGMQTGSRRGVFGLLSAVAVGTLAPLLSQSDTAARKKKKRRRTRSLTSPSAPPPRICKGPRAACAGDCCNGLTCGDNSCDTAPVCCGKAGVICDEDCDCCGELTCRNGVCGCPRNFDCGVECCDTGDETCAWNAETCLNTMCPVATNYCTDPETYMCANECVCMTALDGRTVCTEMPDVCIPCSNDQNCAHMGGNGGVCVRYDTKYCGGICSLPGPGMCVLGVCLDLPSGFAPNEGFSASSVPAKEPVPGTTMSNAPKHKRPVHGEAKAKPKRR